jgi:hypothetical protein
MVRLGVRIEEAGREFNPGAKLLRDLFEVGFTEARL